MNIVLSENSKKIISHYKKATLIHENNSSLYTRLAEYYYEQGEVLEAKRACQKALEKQFNPKVPSHCLSKILQKLNLGVTVYEIYKNLGESYIQKNYFQEAITAYQQAITCNPSDYQSCYKLGCLCLKERKWDKASKYFLKTIQTNPLFLSPYYGLKNLNILGDRINEIIDLYHQIIDNNPDFTPAYIGLGDMLTKKGQLEQAIPFYKAAIYKETQKCYSDFVCHHWNNDGLKFPHFAIIGGLKCGTTSLYGYITKHSNILPAVDKEVLFTSDFLNPDLKFNWSYNKEWYLSRFPAIPENSNFITGEGTPWYLYSYNAPEIFHQLFPRTKLIIVLRDPVKRAFSHHQVAFKSGLENRHFAEAISSEIKIIEKLERGSLEKIELFFESHGDEIKGYLLCSIYIYFIKKWLSHFSRDKILILESEKLYSDPSSTMESVFNFLDVPHQELLEYQNHNPGNYKTIDNATYQKLANLFEPYNQMLKNYLDISFSWA